MTVPSRGLPPGFIDALRGGQTVSIVYLPEKPTTIRFNNADAPATSEMLLGVLLAAIGVYLVRRRRP